MGATGVSASAARTHLPVPNIVEAGDTTLVAASLISCSTRTVETTNPASCSFGWLLGAEDHSSCNPGSNRVHFVLLPMTLPRSSLHALIVTLGLLGIACPKREAATSPARRDTPIARDVTLRVDATADVPPTIVLPAPPPPPPPIAADASTPRDAGAVIPRGFEALLRAVAGGSVSPQSVIDPARGLLLVDFLEATPGPGSRETFTARHLCGESLRHIDGTVRSLLATAVRQSVDMEEAIGCQGMECSVDGMEYQAAIHVRFARRPSGEPVIVAIHRISEALMGEDWLARARRYVARQTADAQTPCPVSLDAGARP
jgi:hypothetical protein